MLVGRSVGQVVFFSRGGGRGIYIFLFRVGLVMVGTAPKVFEAPQLIGAFTTYIPGMYHA